MGQKFWPLINFGMLVRVFESSFGAPQRPSYPPIIHHSSKSDGASSFPMFLGYSMLEHLKISGQSMTKPFPALKTETKSQKN